MLQAAGNAGRTASIAEPDSLQDGNGTKKKGGPSGKGKENVPV